MHARSRAGSCRRHERLERALVARRHERDQGAVRECGERAGSRVCRQSPAYGFTQSAIKRTGIARNRWGRWIPRSRCRVGLGGQDSRNAGLDSRRSHPDRRPEGESVGGHLRISPSALDGPPCRADHPGLRHQLPPTFSAARRSTRMMTTRRPPTPRIREALRTLGLREPTADQASLQRAWRRFARAHHPDRCPGDPDAGARFARGREAYEALSALCDPVAGVAGPRRRIIPAPSATGARLFEPPDLVGREWTA